MYALIFIRNAIRLPATFSMRDPNWFNNYLIIAESYYCFIVHFNLLVSRPRALCNVRPDTRFTR